MRLRNPRALRRKASGRPLVASVGPLRRGGRRRQEDVDTAAPQVRPGEAICSNPAGTPRNFQTSEGQGPPNSTTRPRERHHNCPLKIEEPLSRAQAIAGERAVTRGRRGLRITYASLLKQNSLFRPGEPYRAPTFVTEERVEPPCGGEMAVIVQSEAALQGQDYLK